MSSLGDTAPGLPSAAVLFLIWAFLFYLARLWSKLGKSDPWGSDGTVISLAMAAAIAHVVCIYYAWRRGYDRGWSKTANENDHVAIAKSLYAAQLFFVLSIGLTRTSTALFTARILQLGERYRQLSNAMIAVCMISVPAFLLAIAVRAPLVHPWITLDGSQDMFKHWVIIEVLGLVIDATILAFSIIIVWQLQMSIWKRATVCGLFAVRMLILPVVACRLAQLRLSANPVHPDFNNAASILTEAELQLVLILASATCLKPLFEPFHPGFFAASGADIAVTGYTNRAGGNNSGREAYYELSGAASRIDKDKMSRNSHALKKDDASDEIDLVQSRHRQLAIAMMRPHEGENWSEAVAGTDAVSDAANNRHRIEATRTWKISYEDRDR